MFSRLKSIISSFRNAGRSDAELQGYAPEPAGADPWERLAEQPLSVDAQLAIANQRMSEDMVRQRIRENVQRFRESSDNPASMWALSLVDPFDFFMDTPDFYPGLGMGGGGWGVPWLLNKQGRGDFLPVYINEMGLKLIRDWSRRICALNEFALNALENRISYIVGKGFQYSVVPKRNSTTPAQSLDNEEGIEPSRLAKLAQAVLDEFVSRERWNEREQEVNKRCDRDGEAFLRFFHLGGGRTAVRFVEPEHVTQGQSYQAGEKQADDIWRQYGVNSEPGDIEDVQSYSIVENPIGSWMTRDVPASDILHIKVNTDFDSKRGLPTLFPVRKNLERADKLLRNMSLMAQVQATFAVIRKHKQFGPSSVSAYQQAATDLNVTMPVSGRSLNMRQLQPGSIIDASDKTEYEFPSANVDASGLVAVLQSELRAVAARLVMAEYMLTVDASNANFASTMVAESPFVKKVERDQAFFARHFGDGEYGQSRSQGAMWRVLANAVEGGLLPRETLTRLEIQAEGPMVAARDKEKETRRSQVLSQAGLLSDATWSKWEGLDHEQEVRQGAKPKQQQPAAPGMNGQEPPGFGSETPKPAPPGSAGGMSEGLEEEIRHVFGRCVDTSTHKVVTCPSADSDKGGAERGEKSRGEQLAAEMEKLSETPAGKETLSRGAKIAEKVKAAIEIAGKSALQALDDESKGSGSYLLSSLKKKDAGGVVHGLNAIGRSIFTNVYEEVFEFAMADHSFSGAHAVGVIGAKVAAIAETQLLKAVAWAWSKVRAGESVGSMLEAEHELTDADKRFIAELARIGSEAIRKTLEAAGIESVEVNEEKLGQRILSSLRAA